MTTYRETGWSSAATATGYLAHPIPKVADLDVIEFGFGRAQRGTVLFRNGPWLVVEQRDDPLALIDVRMSEVRRVVWRLP